MVRRARKPVSSYRAALPRPTSAGSTRKRPGHQPRHTKAAKTGKPAMVDKSTVAGNDTVEVRAKLFANGRSQAVRLPKEFRMPGTEVLIHREGNRVILEPVADKPCDANGWPIGLWAELAKWREGLDLDDFQIPDDPVPPPIVPLDQM